MTKAGTLASALLVALPVTQALADEAEFLQALSGNWQGTGQVRLTPEAKLMNVSCSLDSKASGEALNMDGACQALAIFSRKIGADLLAKGASYTGSYIGSRRGTARLSGARSGSTINLQIRWPDNGAGPRKASMQVASLGAGRMRLVTREAHPQTGKQVVTAQIEFSRK